VRYCIADAHTDIQPTRIQFKVKRTQFLKREIVRSGGERRAVAPGEPKKRVEVEAVHHELHFNDGEARQHHFFCVRSRKNGERWRGAENGEHYTDTRRDAVSTKTASAWFSAFCFVFVFFFVFFLSFFGGRVFFTLLRCGCVFFEWLGGK
jgi:hypothetical protein